MDSHFKYNNNNSNPKDVTAPKSLIPLPSSNGSSFSGFKKTKPFQPTLSTVSPSTSSDSGNAKNFNDKRLKRTTLRRTSSRVPIASSLASGNAKSCPSIAYEVKDDDKPLNKSPKNIIISASDGGINKDQIKEDKHLKEQITEENNNYNNADINESNDLPEVINQQQKNDKEYSTIHNHQLMADIRDGLYNKIDGLYNKNCDRSSSLSLSEKQNSSLQTCENLASIGPQSTESEIRESMSTSLSEEQKIIVKDNPDMNNQRSGTLRSASDRKFSIIATDGIDSFEDIPIAEASKKLNDHMSSKFYLKLESLSNSQNGQSKSKNDMMNFELRHLRQELQSSQYIITDLKEQNNSHKRMIKSYQGSLSTMTLRCQQLAELIEAKDIEMRRLENIVKDHKKQLEQLRLKLDEVNERPKDTYLSKGQIGGHTSEVNRHVSCSSKGCSANVRIDRNGTTKTHMHPEMPVSRSWFRGSSIKSAFGRSKKKKSVMRSLSNGQSSSRTPLGQNDSDSVIELKRLLRQKESVITDLRLGSLSIGHQMEQLKDALDHSHCEVQNLRRDKLFLEKVMKSRSID